MVKELEQIGKEKQFEEIVGVKKEGLSEGEQKKYEESYKKYLKLVKVHKADDSMDKLLSRISKAIEGKENTSSKLEAFNQEADNIIKETSGLVDGLKGELEKKASLLQDKAQKKAVEEGLGLIEKWVPGAKTFYKYFKNIGKAFEKVKESSSKGFMATVTAILGVFGVMFGKGKWWGKEAKAGELPEEDEKKQVDTGGEDKKKEETGGKGDEPKEEFNLETKESLISKSGFSIIKFFSIIDLAPGNQFIFQKIKHFKYKDLRKRYLEANNEEVNIEGLNNSKENYKVLHTLFYDYSVSLYETKLTPEKIKKVLNNNKNREIIGENGIKEIQKASYNFRELSFDLISKLVSLSFQGMFTASLYMIEEEVSGVYNYITSDDKLLSTIKDDVEDRKERLFSKNAFNIIKGGKETGKDFGGFVRVGYSKEKLLKDFTKGKNYNEQDERQLDNFLKFRDQIISLKNDPKYTFDLQGFNVSFKAGLDLGKIYILYLLLDGKDLSEIDSFEKGSLYLWIYEILRKRDGKDDISGKYSAKLVQECHDKDSVIFNENDKKILTLLSYRILKISIDNTNSKITHNIDFLNTFISNFLPNNIDEKTKENIIKGAEMLIALALGGYVLFGKKNIALRIFIATSGILGYMALFVAGGSLYRGLGKKMKKDDKKRIDKMLNEMLQSNTIDWKIRNGKGKLLTIPIKSLKDAKQITDGTPPEEIIEQKTQGKTIYLGSDGNLQNLEDTDDRLKKSQETPIFVRTNDEFYILYKGNKFIFDTQTNIISKFVDDKTGKASDKFRGHNLMYNNIEMDIDKGIINFSGTEYSLKIKDIIDIMKKGELKLNFSETIHYYEIDKDGSDSLVLLYNTM